MGCGVVGAVARIRGQGAGTAAASGDCRTKAACGGTRCCALVRRAAGRSEQETLTRMCESCWGPVYALVRRRGLRPADAEDLTQAYFTRFIEKGWVRDASTWRGCFRPFLRVSVRHFLSNHWDRERALKRGGGRVVSLDARKDQPHPLEAVERVTPETLLERKQAEEALAVAFERLTEETGPPGRLARLRPFLAGEAGKDGYRHVAAEWGVGETAVRVAVHRLRRRLGRLVQEALAGRGVGRVSAVSASRSLTPPADAPIALERLRARPPAVASVAGR